MLLIKNSISNKQSEAMTSRNNSNFLGFQACVMILRLCGFYAFQGKNEGDFVLTLGQNNWLGFGELIKI